MQRRSTLRTTWLGGAALALAATIAWGVGRADAPPPRDPADAARAPIAEQTTTEAAGPPSSVPETSAHRPDVDRLAVTPPDRRAWQRRAEGVQAALIAALASGDPAAIERAHALAVDLHTGR